MKKMLKTLNQARKEAPSEFWSSLVYVLCFFGFIWFSIWIEAIITGKV
jgi:hypothetical protein